ncbi:C13 family peptidase [Altererythrobacter arenosus]|uniref:C13 family peptidase n=1 Tax=Altererythrobacter arenosus TaxID=3032592 RepID=A0ABY8FR52_9SPHN|nr:C13 family peptidase [Altererythrobacter sp. CAU 1644]WFL77242.1 C13 family peptidase [Altererythrobacter sp. CAU 1644]
MAASFALAATPLGANDAPRPINPPQHTEPWPTLSTGKDQFDHLASLSEGPEMRRNIPPRELLRERRLLDSKLSALAPQRQGTVDAYVVAIALDSDPVFAREAREAGRVLERRYNAQGRTLVLAGPDGKSADLPQGSVTSLMVALARIAELMDPGEDVLVLYSTSHGLPQGLAYHYGDTGYGIISPQHLRDTLTELGLKRRILMLSACYSGVFVPFLATPDSAILTAARDDRTSFGCEAENDWTFYGDALINNALRKPQSLADAAAEAQRSIAEWESSKKLLASLPQARIGQAAETWLATLEAKIPSGSTKPVGRPAVASD